jgi:formate dehydrogenase iron-sulfur subunit
MPARIFVSRETAAVSMGADDVAAKILARSKGSRDDFELVRNGSWGMSWLVPLVEVETGGRRIAYGPVTPDDVDGLFAAGLLEGGEHPLRQGETQSIPYLAKQERWTFRRAGLGDPLSIAFYREHGGFAGLTKAVRFAKHGRILATGSVECQPANPVILSGFGPKLFESHATGPGSRSL